jgi:hypothetical protein
MRSRLVKKCCSFGVKGLKMMIAMTVMMMYCWCSFEGHGPKEEG